MLISERHSLLWCLLPISTSSLIYEVVSPALPGDDWLPPRHAKASLDQVEAQYLRVVTARDEFDVRTRAVPLQSPQGMTDADLVFEAEETKALTGRALKKDPKLKPAFVTVNLSHLDTCVSCTNYRGLWESMHGTEEVTVGTHLQLLVDDYVVAKWRNVLRQLPKWHGNSS